MEYRILGEDVQVLEVKLQEGEKFYSEPGAMAWMSDNVDMRATTGGKGFLDGIVKAFKRKISGESLAIIEYTSTGGEGLITFAAPAVGKILSTEVKPGKRLFLQRGGYFAHYGDIEVSIAFTKRIGAGLFGGEGFILQKLEGSGLVFFFAGGYIKELELKPGEKLKIDTGCIVGFEEGVDYSVEFIKDIGTWLFGGEGVLLATLRGPGKVWLQSAPLPRLAGALAPYLPISKS